MPANKSDTTQRRKHARILVLGAFALVGLSGIAGSLWPAGEAHAQTQLARTTYLAKLQCGSQGVLALSQQQPLEAGVYGTSYTIFNPDPNNPRTVTVQASLAGAQTGAMSIKTETIPPLETMSVRCAEVLPVFGVLGTPNAVVGSLFVIRNTDDVEVRVGYTERSLGSNAANGGVSTDVERVAPRQDPLFIQF